MNAIENDIRALVDKELAAANKRFPERLRKLREETRIKRYILSQRCGLHSDAIRRYERGEAEPDLLSLIAIADFFEVSLDYLTGRADYR